MERIFFWHDNKTVRSLQRSKATLKPLLCISSCDETRDGNRRWPQSHAAVCRPLNLVKREMFLPLLQTKENKYWWGKEDCEYVAMFRTEIIVTFVWPVLQSQAYVWDLSLLDVSLAFLLVAFYPPFFSHSLFLSPHLSATLFYCTCS